MAEYFPTIGLEIHAELKTQSKMFCGCRNAPDVDEPNVHVCPVCMAHPGTLPVINREAVRHVLRVGVAVDGALADFTEFDRKNYFYPDIPKNYQISQYQYPLVSGGRIGPVAITRIHLEEDTASSSHGTDTSSVNFNRAGVPLMELVTEPVIHDAETAVTFARELRLLLRYLGASDANLEKGEMRIEANISIAPEGGPLGTKVEVKNLNSFKAVEQAIAFEIKRQASVLEAGGRVAQETRGWDENRQKTFSQRAKESSHDYRYFPDPDLPKLYLSELPEFARDVLQKSLPTLPAELRSAYIQSGLSAQVAAQLVAQQDLQSFFTRVCEHLEGDARVRAASYLTTDIVGTVTKPGYEGRSIALLEPDAFASLMQLIDEGVVSSRGAKDVLSQWLLKGGDPRAIAETQGLTQISREDKIASIVQDILAAHESVVADYKNGKEAALQYLVGQGMKASKGAANPTLLQEKIREAILGSS